MRETIDVTPAVRALLPQGRQGGPGGQPAEPRGDYGVKASLSGNALTIELTFPKGSFHCCCQHDCHLRLAELGGRRWYALRWQLADMGIPAPPLLHLHLECIVEEGALFHDGSRPDPSHSGRYAYAPVGAFRYSVDDIEVPEDAPEECPSRLAELSAAIRRELPWLEGPIENLRKRGLGGEALNFLRVALRDSTARTRQNACLALHCLNDPAASVDLRTALADEDFAVAAQAADTLHGLHASAATLIPTLIRVLCQPEAPLPPPEERDESWRTYNLLRGPRFKAAKVLGRLGAEAQPAREALRAALQSASSFTRVEVAKVLAGLGEAAEVCRVPLRQALGDTVTQSPAERVYAARALFDLGESPASLLGMLTQMVAQSDNLRGCCEAVALLGEFGSSAVSAIPALQAALSSKHREVVQAATAALRKIERRG